MYIDVCVGVCVWVGVCVCVWGCVWVWVGGQVGVCMCVWIGGYPESLVGAFLGLSSRGAWFNPQSR